MRFKFKMKADASVTFFAVTFAAAYLINPPGKTNPIPDVRPPSHTRAAARGWRSGSLFAPKLACRDSAACRTRVKRGVRRSIGTERGSSGSATSSRDLRTDLINSIQQSTAFRILKLKSQMGKKGLPYGTRIPVLALVARQRVTQEI